ncbi:MAG: [FeFe] hydrogenase H-cluster radical SAM maturase HydE [Paludibacter sp.]|nr:[FeFe] hydrogenase H-cluster radical SAM maturase HydE [Paludibacter sp.]
MTKNQIVEILSISEPDSLQALYQRANQVKISTIGNKVFLRGLIEFSNICGKNCYYCGIRHDNKEVVRYELSDEQVLEAVDFAWKNHYGSVVLQSGELTSAHFIKRITDLLYKIKEYTNNEVGITLSCGEQTAATYRQWFDAGAHRYLLRIETSNRELYYKLHPNNDKHSFDKRLDAIRLLREEGYQVGTGVMIGLPFQTIEQLADDLLFFQKINVDMVGMGPYLEHDQTPLYQYKNLLLPPEKRLELALKMVSALRILMPDINIAATTALQVLSPMGREQALKAGANVFMPNITPDDFRKQYLLYNNKPGTNKIIIPDNDDAEYRINISNIEIGYDQWGDSKHFKKE